MSNSQNGGRAISDRIFTNLLASAYSLQQRQDRLKSRVSAAKSNELMAAVLETQGLVWHHSVHPDTAMQLIASRSQKLCGAGGAAIALLDGETLEYKVATGIAVGMLGTKILAESSPSFQQLRTQALSESNTWRDKALGTRVTANLVLSVPVRRKGMLAGCIQLFSRTGQFGDESAYVCELMAAILTQLIEETEFRGNGPSEHLTSLQSSDVDQALVIADSAHTISVPAQTESFRSGRGGRSQSDNQRSRDHYSTRGDAPAGRSAAVADRNDDRNIKGDAPTSDLPSRPSKMIYPVVVLIFVAIANTLDWGRPWLLESATIIIVALTGVELIKRW
jgi:hypothetical protein